MTHSPINKKLGFVALPIIIVATLVIAVGAISTGKVQNPIYSLLKPTPSPTISELASVPSAITVATTEITPMPSPSISPSPSLKPSPKPSITPSPKPSTAPAVSGPPGSGYSRISVATERGTFTASVVSFGMDGVRMITDTGNDDNCANECATLSLGDYVARNGGFAGINGSYFCPSTYPDCAGKTNSFDFPVYNSRLGKWINQDKLFWNDRSLIYQDGGGLRFMRNANGFGGGLTAGVTNYPGLVEGGQVIADQWGFSEKQSAKGAKAGIGIRGNTVYLVTAGGVDMMDFAHIFKSLGADSALNLDGGGSIALWYNGYKAGPGRALPNAIIFAR